MEDYPISIRTKQDKLEMKNFFLYTTGKITSLFGTAIYNFALGLYVLKLTGSGLSFAITLFLGVIPMIVMNPFAGVLADKFDKKTLVVAMDLLSGILLISIFLISHFYQLNLLLIYVTTFLLTVFSSFFGIGLEAAKPNIVSERKLMELNSVSKIIDSISQILGPMLGGLVFAFWDIQTFIIINGVTFILSGLLMSLIHFKLYLFSEKKEGQGKGRFAVFNDMKEGLDFFKSEKSIMNMFTILISVNFFVGYAITVPFPYIINSVLELSSKEFGVVQATLPVGMLLGALFVKRILKKRSYTKLLKETRLLMAVVMILSGLPLLFQNSQWDSFIYTGFYMIVMFLFGVTIALIDIPLAYRLQVEIPDEFRGRVMSIGISIGKTMLPIAMIISGFLLNIVPAYLLPMSGGGFFLLLQLRNFTKKVGLC